MTPAVDSPPFVRRGEGLPLQLAGYVVLSSTDEKNPRVSAVDGSSGAAAEMPWPWDDDDWMQARAARHAGELPLAFYRLCADDWYLSRFTGVLDWDRLAQELVPYVADLGFTHVALDTALIGQPEPIVCRFVETCHVAGVGVVVRCPPEASVDDTTLLGWCRRCHVDGLEQGGGTQPLARCHLFLSDAADTTTVLHDRPRWRKSVTDYLALPPALRSRCHADWVAALTPREGDRGLLQRVPESLTAIGQWRQSIHGDDWQRFAALRACLGLMWALPGDKLIAMGVELGQVLAPPFAESMRWSLLFESQHAGILRLVADLNRLYVNEPALQIRDDERRSFEWLIEDDSDNSVIVFARHAENGDASMICLCNFQACVHHRYRLGAPSSGRWREIFNSDSVFYGGSNVGNGWDVVTEPIPSHRHAQSLSLTVPPMAALFLRHEVWYGGSS